MGIEVRETKGRKGFDFPTGFPPAGGLLDYAAGFTAKKAGAKD